MIAIRGAITVDENTKENILAKTTRLFETLVRENNLIEDDMVQITFSATSDLTATYPAVAVRELGYRDTGLFCVQEMNVEGAMEKVIRLVVLVDKYGLNKKSVKHVYLDGARKLRPDLLNR